MGVTSIPGSKQKTIPYGAPGVLGIWEEWLFIFRELGEHW